MTLPHERTRAVKNTREFLVSILTGKAADFRSFRALRQRAARLLRHYPADYEISLAGKKAPDIFEPDDKEPGEQASQGRLIMRKPIPGWRVFECDACGALFEEASRDCLSPSGEPCGCGEWLAPVGHREDPRLPVDSAGNLTESYTRVQLSNAFWAARSPEPTGED